MKQIELKNEMKIKENPFVACAITGQFINSYTIVLNDKNELMARYSMNNSWVYVPMNLKAIKI